MSDKRTGTIEWIPSELVCKACAELRLKGKLYFPNLPQPDIKRRCVFVPISKEEEKEN